MSSGVFLIRCLRPLHNGAGEGLGGIDRPIVREAHTRFPYVQSSSIKGTARAAAVATETWSKDEIGTCFGPEKIRNPSQAGQGALVVTDASLLLFPVPSDAATFVWLSSPLLLARLAQWCELAGQGALQARAEGVLREATLPGPQQALGPEDDRLIRLSSQGGYAFADDAYEPATRAQAKQAMTRLAAGLAGLLHGGASPHEAYWRKFMSRRLVLVSDERLGDLVKQFTVVEPGIAIDDDTGTTTEGSLRYTEFLPEESVLFSYAMVDPALSNGRSDAVLGKFAELVSGVWQLGADESKGKGLVRSTRVTVQAGAVTT